MGGDGGGSNHIRVAIIWHDCRKQRATRATRFIVTSFVHASLVTQCQMLDMQCFTTTCSPLTLQLESGRT